MAVVQGTDFNDNLVSPDARADDTISAFAGDDRIEARGGNDTILPGPGNDRVEGGDGRDAVRVGGSLSEYEIYRFDNEDFLRGPEGILRGPEGVDVLIDVEAVESQTQADGTLELRSAQEFPALSYIASHEDLAATFGPNERSGWDHFRDFGAIEGRQITFDALDYVASHGDLIAAFRGDGQQEAIENDGAFHYILHGRGEGRETTFDGLQYVASNGDLIAAYKGLGDMEAISDAGALHYIVNGVTEGRQPDQFNEASYALLNPDVLAAGLTTPDDLAMHWIQYGAAEGRLGAYDPLIG